MKVMDRELVLGALEEVVDTAGAAEVLGVKPGSIVRYRQPDRAGAPFPVPVRVFGDSPVWLREDVEAWAEARPGRGAGGGRPRKVEDPAPIVRCAMSGRTVTWIPREKWAEADLVECLSGCHQQVKFRVRASDLPGHARILPHMTDGRPTR